VEGSCSGIRLGVLHNHRPVHRSLPALAVLVEDMAPLTALVALAVLRLC
jgi:hypothetical protein